MTVPDEQLATVTATEIRRRQGPARHNGAGAETRARLLDTAERLFADHGVDAVSVRDITEASAANTAAIHYHFGSKQDLIAAILERRAATIGRRRTELLARLEGAAAITLRQTVEALVLPTAELVEDPGGGRNYVALLASLGTHAELLGLVMGAYDPYTDRYLRALARVTPGLPDDVRILRFAVGKDLVNRVLGQPASQVHQWVQRQSPGADAGIVTKLIDMLVGIFEGPVSS